MGMVDGIIEAIVAIIIVMVFFFSVLPELAKVTGFSEVLVYIIGLILIAAIILSLFKR